MSDGNGQMTRREALDRRIVANELLREAQAQSQVWHALCTALGAIVRKNRVSDPQTSAYFSPILVKAVNRERLLTQTENQLAAEVSFLSAHLRQGDTLVTYCELRDEQAESEGI